MRRFILSVLLGIGVVQAEVNSEAFPQAPNIKGLQVQMVADALELGIHHAGINVNLSALLDLEQKPGHSVCTVEGHRFAFNDEYLASLDRQIQPLSERGVIVYLILIAYPSQEAARDTIVIHPSARADHKYSVGAFNSVTPMGRAYLRAVIELLAERWSGAHPEKGRVWGWIVGNEVNSHWLWYNLGAMPLEQAASHYETAFRIIHQAVRSASQQARLYVSFDHHWAQAMAGISVQEATAGRNYLDTFARLVRERGDLDWHVAWHPYPEDLGNPRAWADQTVTTTNDSPKVTFKNLEVLPRHLARPELLYEGKPRRIILSEQGFHTLAIPEGEKLQAAAYAYAWEKCRLLPTVDAFIYHRHVDHSQEGGLRLGLWRNVPGSIADPEGKKLLWNLFQKAGTDPWRVAADACLPITGLQAWPQAAPSTDHPSEPER
ncbi:hypothetical protein SAMN02745166_00455 [Prosthecobacter debontii]|uniref:DUF5722 domain-containing protein n=1 Tax=Prosthecobacter debontii TaxID=48467 RepID=A0A1T4WL31_9BACT|nr:DUF5722 domain-containing protein [Prosthecobacter debontii]SKA78043.1 hypothetical protein SAMN02745166_00455 [Prosthecobacter debontii]